MEKYMIQTARLGLRLIEKADLPEMAKLNADPEARQFFPDGIQTLEQTEARMQDFMDFYRDKGIPCFTLFELESQKFVGRAGFGLIETGSKRILAKNGPGFAPQTDEQSVPISFLKKSLKEHYHLDQEAIRMEPAYFENALMYYELAYPTLLDYSLKLSGDSQLKTLTLLDEFLILGSRK